MPGRHVLPGGRLLWHDEDDAWPAWADARTRRSGHRGRWESPDGAVAVVLGLSDGPEPLSGRAAAGSRRRESRGSSDAGPRTDQMQPAVNAVISTAPSMCTRTSRSAGSVKYCTKPIDALRQLDDQQVARRPADPVGRVGRVAARPAGATVSPTSRNTRSACSWLSSAGSSPVRGGLRVAGCAGRCR